MPPVRTDGSLSLRRVLTRLGWLWRGFPAILAAVTAGLVLVLSPFWALEWFRTPFLGVFLEPNLVASQIRAEDWPAAQAGVAWSDRLVMVGDHPVLTWGELRALLDENGYAPVSLTFERVSLDRYELIVTPREVKVVELVTQFGIPYLTGLVFFLSGLWAYWLGKRSRPAHAFLVFTAAVCITTGAFLDMNTTHYFVVGWSLSLLAAGGALAYLALVFPRPMTLVERFPLVRFLPWATVLLPVPGTLRNLLAPASSWAYVDSWRWGYLLLAAGMLLFVGASTARAFFSSVAMVRQQSRIIVFGALLAFGPVLSLYLVPSSIGMTPEFNAALYLPPLALFPLSIAYAIARYRLLDVDQILADAVTYGLVTLIVVGFFYAVIAIFSFALQKSLSPSSPLVLATYIFVLVVALNPLRSALQAGVDRLFYRTRADYRSILSVLSHELGKSLDVEETFHLLERELNLALTPTQLYLYLYDNERGMFLPYGQERAGGVIPAGDPFLDRLRLSEGPLWISEPGVSAALLTGDGQSTELAQLNCQVYVPLRYEGILIGFLGLGARRSGEPYHRDDLQFVSAVGGQSVLALQNARLFANLRRTLAETREMKNLMDDAFSSMTTGILTTSLDGQITLFNRAAESILGVESQQVLGQPFSTALAPIPAEVGGMVQSALQSGTTTLQEEALLSWAGKSYLSLRLSCTPLRDAQMHTIGATLVFDDLTEQRQVEAERERIRQTFGRVVAPRVRDRLLSDPSHLRVEGVRQPLTILFADLSSFTPFSERTQPETLVQVLNSYLSLAAQVVLEEEGTLDKFVGDAVMAFWNAPDEQPDHTLRAIRTALKIQSAAAAHRASLPPEHRLHYKVSISCGDTMVGNVGSEGLFNYTAIGDTVNLAQRLESIAAPGQILISETVYRAMQDLVVVRRLADTKVKGKEQPVAVFELLGMKAD